MGGRRNESNHNGGATGVRKRGGKQVRERNLAAARMPASQAIPAVERATASSSNQSVIQRLLARAPASSVQHAEVTPAPAEITQAPPDMTLVQVSPTRATPPRDVDAAETPPRWSDKKRWSVLPMSWEAHVADGESQISDHTVVSLESQLSETTFGPTTGLNAEADDLVYAFDWNNHCVRCISDADSDCDDDTPKEA